MNRCVIGVFFLFYGCRGTIGADQEVLNELSTLKNTIKVLSDQWEKWNTLFVMSLEPRITSTASILASIDSNVHNLQERAHVWDTFQLHVAAWNDQLATMDRKMDILNKAIEQLPLLDNKIGALLADDYKTNKLLKTSETILESVVNVENGMKVNQQQGGKTTKSSLFEEFALRGILSSLKLVERKVDQLLSVKQLRMVAAEAIGGNKCSKTTENRIDDIASKVDVIFDTISKSNPDYASEDYIEIRDAEGSGGGNGHYPKTLGQSGGICKSVQQEIRDFSNRFADIDRNLATLMRYNQLCLRESASNTNNNAVSRNDLTNLLRQFAKTISLNQTKSINLALDSYLHENKVYWASMLNQCLVTPKYATTTTAPKPRKDYVETTTTETTRPYLTTFEGQPKIVNLTSCNDLDGSTSNGGIYIFKNGGGDFANERFFNKQYCETRPDGLWTVVQRRDNYTVQQDFNVSWHDYGLGFGNLQRDFWIGNNYLARLSRESNLTLRIELYDFEGHNAWAEYKTFRVADEERQFRLTVGGYSGNASDALSSHNGSPFSTYDKKNDYAPDCCPCAVSYGGGWWFNRCFESNLNGVYYKRPFENDYFRGIIWEHWLGNYSLKKSLMMVKTSGSTQFYDARNKIGRPEDP